MWVCIPCVSIKPDPEDISQQPHHNSEFINEQISTNERVLMISSPLSQQNGCLYQRWVNYCDSAPEPLFIHGRCQSCRVYHGWRICEDCYGNVLSRYPTTNIALVQCLNLIKNQMQIHHTKYYKHYSSIGEVMPKSVRGPGYFLDTVYNCCSQYGTHFW